MVLLNFFAYYHKSCYLSSKPSNAHAKIFPCTCIELGIEKRKEKEELKTMLMWGTFFKCYLKLRKFKIPEK